MTKFRPCIDLHAGQVKQIVGGTLTTASADLKTNYVSKLPAGHFAKLYKDNGLEGAHVIMLGPGNEDSAKEALAQWKGGLQIGGGITDQNARQWIEWGAERVRLDLSHNRRSSGLYNVSLESRISFLLIVANWSSRSSSHLSYFHQESFRQSGSTLCLLL